MLRRVKKEVISNCGPKVRKRKADAVQSSRGC